MTSYLDHIKKIKITPKNLISKFWRIENLYPIRNKQGVLIPFRMNNFQIDVYERLNNNLINGDYSPIIILKSRQVGISTLFCIYFLDQILFYEGQRGVIQSQKQETMLDIFAICRTALTFIPDDIKVQVGIKNSVNKIDEKQSKINIPKKGSSLESKLEVRSIAVNLMHFSEYAFTEKDRIIASVGSLAPNCIKIYESTPNGMNHFYDLWREQKEKNPKNCFFFPWYEHKEYRLPIPTHGLNELSKDEADLKSKHKLDDNQVYWMQCKQDEMRALDDNHRSFYQEFPSDDESCFLLSGSSLIEPAILREIKDECDKTQPIERFWDGKCLVKLFKEPDPYTLADYYTFKMGVDPAEGIQGGDYSVAIMCGIDRQFNTEVFMTLRGFIKPPEFKELILKYTKKWFFIELTDGRVLKPQIIVERNGVGHAVLTLLQPVYGNMYWHIKSSFKPDRQIGFPTTSITRSMILNNLFNLINDRKIKIRDPVIASELRTLIKNDVGKIEAETGKHDDTIFALALAIQGRYAQTKNFNVINS